MVLTYKLMIVSLKAYRGQQKASGMNHHNLNEILEKLTPRRQEVLRLVLAGESDEAIACVLNIKPVTVRKYLERLYEAFQIGKRVELVTLFAKYKPEMLGNINNNKYDSPDREVSEEKVISATLGESFEQRKQDLGEAPDTLNFYGRTQEIKTLTEWIVTDKCRLVAILGMGGLGKTALSVKLVELLSQQFDWIFWRSLREAPKLESILVDAIKFLSNHKKTELQGSISDQITHLLNYLRSSRCLLILDNFESILQDKVNAGEYRQDYEEYGVFIQRIGESSHQSCIVLTSRTKPEEIAVQEGESQPIRSLLLKGLEQTEATIVLEDKGLSGSVQEMLELVELYSGNPLALKIVSTFIKDLFNGKIAEFLSQGLAPFLGIESLLDSQFNSLSELEKEIMYWLAINREPVYMKKLFDDMLEKPMFSSIIESLENLKRRSLIEAVDGRFTLQNVLMEYMIALLVRQVSEEIHSGEFHLFNKYPLIQATAKDYIRNSQEELILKSVLKNIIDVVEIKLLNPLKLQEKNIYGKGYKVGNILNLLRHQNYNLSNLDLSNLTIWQAYLRGADLRNVKFTNSDLDMCRFTEAFGTVLCLASCPKKSIWAMGDTKSKIRLRHSDNGHQLLTLQGHTNWVRSVVFSADGNLLASASDDKTLMLWDTDTGQCLQTFRGHKERVWTVAISPDGQTLASGCEDKTVRIWDIKTGECSKILEKHTAWVRSVAFSPDGKILASSSSDKTVILWDARTGEYLKTLEGHTGRVRTVAFNPDSKILASGSDDNTVILWKIESGKCLKILQEHTAWVRSVAFSPDGKTLASGSEDRKVILWDIDNGKLRETLSEHTAKVWSVTFSSSDGKSLISSSDDKTVKLWDANTGKCLKTLQGYTDWSWSVAYSPDGNFLASSSEDQTVKLWNVHNGQVEKIFKSHVNRIRAVAISPDGKILASGSDDKTIKLWDMHTGQLLKTLTDHVDRVLTIAFSPDGQNLASGGDDKQLRIWNIHTGQCRKTRESHRSWIWSVAFSPDGETIASGSEDRTINLWDASNGECRQTLKGHIAWVLSVAFHPQGGILASGSEDQTVKLWDLKTGECLRTFKGKTGWVRSVAFSPDGCFLAIVGGYPIVEIWDISTESVHKVFQGHQERLWSVRFSPDGKTLASSSEDGSIGFWEVETGKLLRFLTTPRLYEGMDITGVVNLTEAQINTLKTLGANKNDG